MLWSQPCTCVLSPELEEWAPLAPCPGCSVCCSRVAFVLLSALWVLHTHRPGGPHPYMGQGREHIVIAWKLVNVQPLFFPLRAMKTPLPPLRVLKTSLSLPPDDTFAFWRGLRDAGLLDDVIQEFHQELLDTMRGLQQRAQDPPPAAGR